MRSVLVTGASTGIGRATALRLDASGWKVFAGVREEAAAEALKVDGSDRLTPVFLDVTEPDQIAAVAELIEAEGEGGLDGLVNNAGVAIPGTVDQIDVDSYRAMIATNIDGVFFTSRAALPHLRTVRGCIVNVGSVAGLRAEWNQAVYNMTKGALTNLTNSMALDHGREIRVNAVHPGVTLSRPFLRDALAEGSPLLRRFADRVPMGRPGEPAEVAAVIAFLAGPDAGYLNGVHIPVDGGLTASDGQTNLYKIDG
jgi:meso-butanediol dehydrogenase/(S,S)-butanediol dehydrogenase/diacetyl reductase